MLVKNASGVLHTIPDKLNDGRWYYDVMDLKSEDIRIVCPVCGKEFYVVDKYLRHLREHEKKNKEDVEVKETSQRGRPPKK